MSDPQPLLPDPAMSSPDATPAVEVDAIYQNGIIKPLARLDLPPDTPLRVRIMPRLAQTEATVDPLDTTSLDGQESSQADSDPGWHVQLLVLTGLAIGLAVLGQYLLHHAHATTPNTFPWMGTGVYLGAVLIFWAATLVARQPVLDAEPAPATRPISLDYLWHTRWRAGALLAAVTCIGGLLYVLQLEPPLPSYNGWAMLWLGAIGLYLAAIRPPQRLSVDGTPRRPRDLRLLLAVGVIVGIALVLRVWQLGDIPPTLGGDEGSQGLEAMRVMAGTIANPFTTGWLGVPSMSFYFNALSIAPLGNTMFALRLPWALIGTLTVLVVFLLVKRLFGVMPGLLVATLLATYHYHIHFSRLGSNQVADTLFVALALLFFYRGYDRRNPLDWALCGITIGVAQYFYAGARFTAIVIIAMLVFFSLRDRARFWRSHGSGVLVMVAATVLVAAPMIQYALRFPGNYNARINEVGIVQSGWLEREQDIRNQGALPILLDQFQRAALAFNYYPDRTMWYGSPRPLFGFGAAALFVLGFGYSVLHLYDRRIFPMVAWWGGAMIMGGMLTESPPSSQRLITMAAPAVFFVVLALLLIGRLLVQAMPIVRPRLLTPMLGTAVLIIGLFSIKWYFMDFTPMRVYGNYNAVVATSLGKYAHDVLGPDWRIVFFGAPRMYIGFGSITYLAPDVPGTDIIDPLTEAPRWDLAEQEANVAFVFVPERIHELDLVRQAYPGGSITVVPPPPPYNTQTDDPLYTIYSLQRAQINK